VAAQRLGLIGRLPREVEELGHAIAAEARDRLIRGVMIESMPNAYSSGATAITATAVVQLGPAMMPTWPARSPALI
jgi:hypothetical protein